jgi:hypothetical protein
MLLTLCDPIKKDQKGLDGNTDKGDSDDNG